MNILIKRVYEPAAKSDGFRVLVDRLWPRGLSKKNARIDLWLRDIGPSTTLRKWFRHDPIRWKEFIRRYHTELKTKKGLLAAIKQQAQIGPVTLLYSAKDEQHNHAIVLRNSLGTRSVALKPITRATRPATIATATRKKQ